MQQYSDFEKQAKVWADKFYRGNGSERRVSAETDFMAGVKAVLSSVLPQSEGGLQWVKGRYDELYRQVKSGIETPCLVDYQWDDKTVCRDICRIKPHNLELSSRGHCYGSIFMRPGRSEEQEFISMCKSANVEWIPVISNSTSNTEKGADKWTPEEIQGLENQIDLLEGRVYKLSNQLEASKEQQIAFAEWTHKEFFVFGINGLWHERPSISTPDLKYEEKGYSSNELYDLFQLNVNNG